MEVSSNALALQVNYSLWATRRLLTQAGTLPENTDILKKFQHIYYADRTWFSRLDGAPWPTFEDPAPGPGIADLEREWPPLLARLEDYARQCDPMQILAYKNLKGQPFERPVWQVILHIVNHGTYHRGQAASLLKQAGAQPPPTDLIYYYLSLP
jgi:uncharacterized damage-inducible protein DinB